jgi:hypothetical protein
MVLDLSSDWEVDVVAGWRNSNVLGTVSNDGDLVGRANTTVNQDPRG